MALDGIVISNIVYELREKLLNERITKIAQPQKDALLLNKCLFISVDPSLPYVCLTKNSYKSPDTAPVFCMSLRKHIANGRITDISQPNFDRIIRFEVEHLDELGDMSKKYLYVELMGKHSNIIFTDANSRIIDAIRHVGITTSSVRTVLPGSNYFMAGQNEKSDPLTISGEEEFIRLVKKNDTVERSLYMAFFGISPLISNELLHIAAIDPDRQAVSLEDAEFHRLYVVFDRMMKKIAAHEYAPNIVLKNKKPVEFSSVELTCYSKGYEKEGFETVSDMLEKYFYEKNIYSKVKSKSADMRKHLSGIVDRDTRKLALMKKQMEDTKKMDKYKLRGELLRAYSYMIEQGASEAVLNDYNTGKDVKVPLDPEMNAIENANAYFNKYNKLKRTVSALEIQMSETESELEYVKSVLYSLDIATGEDDLNAIREELVSSGLVKKKKTNEKIRYRSEPLHFISSDGFHIYVGRNNDQNEYVSFKLAGNSDYWFHAKKIPGSHVIVKAEGKELPDRTYEEASMIAGFYSSGRQEGKLDIDYVMRKELKKPPGSPKGYVIYHTNYSMTVEPQIPEGVDKLNS